MEDFGGLQSYSRKFFYSLFSVYFIVSFIISPLLTLRVEVVTPLELLLGTYVG